MYDGEMKMNGWINTWREIDIEIGGWIYTERDG